MNTDIRIKTSLIGHLKTKKVLTLLGYEGFYSLISLWIYAAENKPKGCFNGMDADDIAMAANYDGEGERFVSGLIKAGFLTKENGSYILHDWAEHNPYAYFAEERSEKAKRSIKTRWDKYKQSQQDNTKRIRHEYEIDTPSPSPSPSPTPNVKKKEKQEKEKFDPTKYRPDKIPAHHWEALLENRKNKKLENTELALKRLLSSFNEAEQHGYAITDCIEEYVSSKMQRFHYSWMDKNRQEKGNGKAERGKVGFTDARKAGSTDWLG